MLPQSPPGQKEDGRSPDPLWAAPPHGWDADGRTLSRGSNFWFVAGSSDRWSQLAEREWQAADPCTTLPLAPPTADITSGLPPLPAEPQYRAWTCWSGHVGWNPSACQQLWKSSQ